MKSSCRDNATGGGISNSQQTWSVRRSVKAVNPEASAKSTAAWSVWPLAHYRNVHICDLKDFVLFRREEHEVIYFKHPTK